MTLHMWSPILNTLMVIHKAWMLSVVTVAHFMDIESTSMVYTNFWITNIKQPIDYSHWKLKTNAIFEPNVGYIAN